MRTRKGIVRTGFLLAVLSMLWLGVPAQGYLVTVNDVVVFDGGGFEADTVGQKPDAQSPMVGEWSYATGIGDNAIVLGAASAGPGAYEGDKYIRLTRTELSPDDSILQAWP